MTRDEFVELVRRNLQGSDAPAAIRGKYSDREIRLYVSMAYDDIIGEFAREATKTRDFSLLDTFGRAYKRNILYDAEREELYIDLQVQVVPLNDNMGIRLVCPFRNQNDAYHYRDNNASSVFSKLLVAVVNNTPSYYVELPRIYLDNKVPKGTKTLMIKIIPPFSRLKGTDEVFVPGGANGEMFAKVIQFVQNKQNNPQMYNNSGSSKQI